MSNTQSQQLMVEWHSINWRKLERRVYKLQKRIYQASIRGDVKTIRRPDGVTTPSVIPPLPQTHRWRLSALGAQSPS